MRTITPRGSIWIDDVRFTSDPDSHEFDWPPRLTKLEGIGSVTIQEFDMTIKDLVLRLESGKGGILDLRTVAALETLRRVVGAAYDYRDSHGNAFTVKIASFPYRRFAGDTFTYSMELWVTAATFYLGAAYTEVV